MNNTMSKAAYISDNVFWALILMFWYKFVFFSSIPGCTLKNSKIIFYALIFLLVSLGILITIKSRRNGRSVFINTLFPYGVYTMLVIWRAMAAVILFSCAMLLVFALLQSEIRKTWGKLTLAACLTLFLTVSVFMYNALLRYLFRKPVLSDTGYTYTVELKNTLCNTEGFSMLRYVLYAAVIMAVCSVIILVHKLIVSKKLSKAIWQMRMRAFTHRIKRTKRIPASYVILDAPTGYGKTHFVRTICGFFPGNEVRLLSSEQFSDTFYALIRRGEYHSDELPMAEVFKDARLVVIEDIDMFLSAGCESTQIETAKIFSAAIENGVSIIITGIDIFDKAPFFFREMNCMNFKSEKYIAAK